MLRNADNQLELLRMPATEGDTPNRPDKSELQDRRSKAMMTIAATADIEADAVIKLFDHIIDVARQDIQGRY